MITGTVTQATIEELLEAMLSVGSVQRLYQEGLKSETVKYIVYCTLYIVKDRPVLSSEMVPHINKPAAV
jgi:hypothetical protein